MNISTLQHGYDRQCDGLCFQEVRAAVSPYLGTSCLKNGALRFHWKCLMAPVTIIDYIIVHELGHLHHRDQMHVGMRWTKYYRTIAIAKVAGAGCGAGFVREPNKSGGIMKACDKGIRTFRGGHKLHGASILLSSRETIPGNFNCPSQDESGTSRNFSGLSRPVNAENLPILELST
jgi:hypothetical protein